MAKYVTLTTKKAHRRALSEEDRAADLAPVAPGIAERAPDADRKQRAADQE